MQGRYGIGWRVSQGKVSRPLKGTSGEAASGRTQPGEVGGINGQYRTWGLAPSSGREAVCFSVGSRKEALKGGRVRVEVYGRTPMCPVSHKKLPLERLLLLLATCRPETGSSGPWEGGAAR